MAAQRQTVAQLRVEVFNQRAAARHAAQCVRDRSPDPLELMAQGGMQPVPALPEGA
jgi:hypothetical protein